MGDLFEEEDNEIEQPLDLDVEVEEELIEDDYQASPSAARRKLEALLAEKKLRDELEDFFDDFEE